MRLVFSLLFSVIVFSFFVSCNKEKSFEVGAPAVGSLKSDSASECLPKTAIGAFIAGTALSDSNYLEVDVDVISTGSYTIHTDTLNGYSFSGSGNFEQTGVNHIRLTAKGTPLKAGEDQFRVFFNADLCYVPVTVLPAGTTSGPATFTLQGSGDSCLSYAVSGTYPQNVPLTAANKVAIKITATTPGTYTVTTNTLNEIRFSGSGTLSSTGTQTIILTGTGTPATEGPTVFTVTAGNTTCKFTVNVTTGSATPPSATDSNSHFPLTSNSYWTYDVSVPGAGSDTAIRTNAGSTQISGNTYKLFIENSSNETDTTLYRKGVNNTDYYTLVPVDAYTQIELDTPQYAEMIFLKEGLKTGDIWSSAQYSGVDNGKNMVFKYVYTCTNANASITVNNQNFTNVYVIDQKVEGTENGAPYVPEGGAAKYTFYYAKGIGLIKVVSQSGGVTDLEINIRHWSIK